MEKFINEEKIIDFLQNDLKVALYKIQPDHTIVIASPISNLKKLSEFVEPLHYYLSYVCNSIYIHPK